MFDFPATPTTGQQITMPDGTVRLWDGSKWVAGAYTPPALVPAQNNTGRNLVHNALFNVAQRGAGAFTAFGAYTLDRWVLNGSLDTASVGQFVLTDADRAQIGDEAANICLQNGFTGNAAAGASNNLVQRIEDVRRLAGKTITVSFYAKAVTGTPKLGVNMSQNFGTGGSPSASVTVLSVGNSVTLSTVWTRFSMTIAVPSIAGKTLGTSSDHYIGLQFWFSAGATLSATAGNIGVQSGTVYLWGVQLEIGSVATPLDYGGTPQQQLAACQRYYQVGQLLGNGYSVASVTVSASSLLPVLMRATPTVALGSNFSTGVNTPTLGTVVGGVFANALTTATAGYSVNCTFTASADL